MLAVEVPEGSDVWSIPRILLSKEAVQNHLSLWKEKGSLTGL